MNRIVSRIFLLAVFVSISCIIAICMSKLLNMPIDHCVAWMALGSCCGRCVDDVLNG